MKHVASFNVLTEPWIPMRDATGRVRECGIIEALATAHESTAIVDPAPSMEFGMYRLLIAFVMDAFGLQELSEIEGLLGRGKFDRAALEVYAAAISESRFDLFHPEHPFLQVPPCNTMEEQPQSVAQLVQHLPFGSFATHFHHVMSRDQALSPAVCARGLTTISPFMTAGGRGYSPSINGSPPWYALARGRSLFETTVLNCYALSDLGLDRTGPPAWSSHHTVGPRQEARCSSIPEGLTWQPRRVRLIPGDGGVCTYSGRASPVLVRMMVFGTGLRFSGTWTDPHVAYRETEKARSPLRPREDRELWRDIGPLMLLRKEDYSGDGGRVRFSRPAVIEQLRELRRDGVIDRLSPDTVEVYGMRTDGNMKIFEWQHEQLSLPSPVVQNPRSGTQLQYAMDMADRISYWLGAALRKAYPRRGKGNDRALGTIIRSAQRRFWTTLHQEFENDYLPTLAAQDIDNVGAPLELEGRWKGILRRIAAASFEEALAPLDAEAGALRRQVEARDFFTERVRISLYPPRSADRRTKPPRRTDGGRERS